jgi:hypothetical protein
MVEVGVGQLAACVEKVDKAVCEESSALRAGTATSQAVLQCMIARLMEHSGMRNEPQAMCKCLSSVRHLVTCKQTRGY